MDSCLLKSTLENKPAFNLSLGKIMVGIKAHMLLFSIKRKNTHWIYKKRAIKNINKEGIMWDEKSKGEKWRGLMGEYIEKMGKRKNKRGGERKKEIYIYVSEALYPHRNSIQGGYQSRNICSFLCLSTPSLPRKKCIREKLRGRRAHLAYCSLALRCPWRAPHQFVHDGEGWSRRSQCEGQP